jgi:hypothetical protein
VALVMMAFVLVRVVIKMHTEFWSENVKERDPLEDLDIDE